MSAPSHADLASDAAALIAACRTRRLMLVAAESCTGGLIAATLTEIAGASEVFDRGFVTYSNEAKTTMLGVPAEMIAARGAVSEEVARAMAAGALARSNADIALAVTGVAGPGGGSPDKPVGLVHIGAARRGGKIIHHESRFGNIGRAPVRRASVAEALRLAHALL